jgi:iron(II)-dependent oxidoreductase
MDETSQVYSKAQALRTGGRTAVREALLETRRRTLELADAYADALATSALQVPYAPQLNPPLWEWGHLAWFQEYWVGRNRQRHLGVRCQPDHARFPSWLPQTDLWYDSSRVEHRSRWSLPLPDLPATQQYLKATLEQTLVLLDQLPDDASHDELYFFRLVALHEAMHAEAAVYMARTLGIPLPQPEPVQPQKRPALTRLALPAQTIRLGSAASGFAFDNELHAHEVALDPFEIDSQPVSWARFMPFVRAGGCEPQPGWAEAAAGDPHAPAVHVSAAHAQAWCDWAGRRLPSEAEWQSAASAPGFAWGEVWEWSACDFEPYPGFTPHPYRDYSQPWFGSRRVLRGACSVTSPWLAHPGYRNFFEPQRSDIFAGFRSCA